jgi:NtrC-family two-component system response regulator AlgB
MSGADPSPLRVLVIDDEPNIRDTLALCIQAAGARADKVGSGAAALEALRLAPYDLAFCDLRLGPESGLDLVPRLLAERPGLDVVVITAFATFDTAVEAIRRGARDYLPKPFTPQQIRLQLEAARQRRATASRLDDLEARLADAAPDVRLESASPRVRGAVETLLRAAPHDVSVLIRGESGTGKGVLARALHAASPRRERPFVVVNCPTLSEELLASELFGHARGSFTGATRDQAGRIEAAEGGTVFLDEIGEISPTLQAKLLRFLQEKRFERIGENRTRVADVRIVAATNRDLESAVKDGRFREDLLYRLNVVEVTVPPLRERTEDILPLARTFVSFFARQARRPPPEISSATEQMLLAWPKRPGAGGDPHAGTAARARELSGAHGRARRARSRAGRRLHRRGDRAGAHPSGARPHGDPGRGGADPGTRRLDALAEAQEGRAVATRPAAARPAA